MSIFSSGFGERGAPVKRVRRFAALCIALVLLLSGCKAWNRLGVIEDVLGLDLSGGTLEDYNDTHSAMSDGTTFAKIVFADGAVEERIRQDARWNTLPVSETAETLFYGTSEERDGTVYSAGPFLTDRDGAPLFPKVKAGYWFLLDRQTGFAGEVVMLNRYSFNFTAALYDSASRTLYFAKLDT